MSCPQSQARLQQYAERVAALEILNMNYKSQENEEDDNGAWGIIDSPIYKMNFTTLLFSSVYLLFVVENTDQHSMFLSGDEADSGSARVLSLSDAKQ